ncbi:uracil-DNA glycosylase [Gorillibacterium sp. sgz5001074]|uniref:uracil-DNA glycosylase n=1 Tax=Gorillibacterium sp. sgz5001074 TaxID=3446695 RepID=UPI003F6697D0
MAVLHNGWAPVLEPEFGKPYYQELRNRLADEYRSVTVYPDMYEIYSAFHLTDYAGVKAVILGQDPYHGPGQAHGLSFSVKPGIAVPPSLQNIYKELRDDLGSPIPNHGYLEAWAKQGVLMLNAVLTVRKDTPNSHRGLGWEAFTNRVIELLNEREQPVVFILWGKNAQEKRPLITESRHLVIQSAHPSPFAANKGFFGSKPFSRTNAFLKRHGIPEIDWTVPDL